MIGIPTLPKRSWMGEDQAQMRRQTVVKPGGLGKKYSEDMPSSSQRGVSSGTSVARSRWTSLINY